ncbi:MAG: glycosyltransferase family 1 protein [Thermotogae bacterium]|nr:glycosyltransferase family 1 protein [Thermotogota bacterium]
MRRDALLLSSNRWDGVLDVGVFKLAHFLKRMGFNVEHANLENPITFLRGKGGITHRMIRPLPNRWMHWRWLWEITFRLQPYAGLRRRWDLLMVDASPLLYFANRIKASLKVYRLNDLLLGFKVPKVILQEEREFIERSDLILVAHKNLMGKVPEGKSVYLPNPIELDLFPLEGDFPQPEDLTPIPKPRAVYVGAVADWFDWRSLLFAAHNLKDISFVIVGPVRVPPPFQLPENVYILGPKPHREVHLYLRHSDVALVPFKLSPLIESMDFPNKVLEYFALGLPTVSVFWPSFAKNFPQVVFYRSVTDFPSAIKKALHRGKNPDLRRLILPFSSERIYAKFKSLLNHLSH